MHKRTLGFIILRKVFEIKDNINWMGCYNCIRKYYPNNEIVIIDDNSNYKNVNVLFEKTLVNTIVVNNKFKNTGEISLYYYYYHNNYFDIAVIIPDYMFIIKYIDFMNVQDYHLLWDFGHKFDSEVDEKALLHNLRNNKDLLQMHENKYMWKSCYKGILVITHTFLSLLEEKFNILNLINIIDSAEKRSSFERILGVVLNYHEYSQNKKRKKCIFGDVFLSHPWISDFSLVQSNQIKSAVFLE
jgi:hypothetical protein